jgi:hypothetical protein
MIALMIWFGPGFTACWSDALLIGLYSLSVYYAKMWKTGIETRIGQNGNCAKREDSHVTVTRVSLITKVDFKLSDRGLDSQILHMP